MCCPPDWGATSPTLRRASRGARFGEMRVLSQGLVVVWAAEPQIPGARRAQWAGASAVRARRSTRFHRAKSAPPERPDRVGKNSGRVKGSCRVVRGCVGDEAERALFFLRVVQPEHGVQPVKQPAEFDDVLGFGACLLYT